MLLLDLHVSHRNITKGHLLECECLTMEHLKLKLVPISLKVLLKMADHLSVWRRLTDACTTTPIVFGDSGILCIPLELPQDLSKAWGQDARSCIQSLGKENTYKAATRASGLNVT